MSHAWNATARTSPSTSQSLAISEFTPWATTARRLVGRGDIHGQSISQGVADVRELHLKIRIARLELTDLEGLIVVGPDIEVPSQVLGPHRR